MQYFLPEKEKTWHKESDIELQMVCKKQGAHLVSFDDQSKYNYPC